MGPVGQNGEHHRPERTGPLAPSRPPKEPAPDQAKGDYVVNFNTDVSACSWSASPFFRRPAAGGATLRAAVTEPCRAIPSDAGQGVGLRHKAVTAAATTRRRAGALLIRSAAATAPAGPVAAARLRPARRSCGRAAAAGRAPPAPRPCGATRPRGRRRRSARSGGRGGNRRTRRRSGPSSPPPPPGEAEVPFGVLVPGVGLQERVLLAGAGLDGAPVASEDVLVGRDQAPGAADAAIAPGSFRVAPSPRRPSGSPCRLARCGSGDAVRLSRRPVDPYVNSSASDRAASAWHRGAWIEQELAHALTRWWRAHPG